MAEDLETVIGLECHVELATATKMFCGCPNSFGAPPNTNVCPICLGHPGTLPVPNEKAIEFIVKIGLALECRVAPHSLFHRKNYFYPDMPKNFQISQYDLPICVDGHLDVEVDGEVRRIGITRVHLEEDTGKTAHASATGRIAQAEYALEDYNRAGVPLVEVVSEPDLRSADQARAYFTEVRGILEALGVSDVRMEEGSLRCDANVSVRRRGEGEFGTKVEIKNLNSIRSLHRALLHEEDRLRRALIEGTAMVQETRHWDESRGITTPGRSKEYASDYRYFPEPDLTPLEPDAEWVEKLRAQLPELPAARRRRFEQAYGLDRRQAALIAARQDLAASKVAPAHVADLVRLVGEGAISSAGAKAALSEAFATGAPIEEIVEAKGLIQVSDSAALDGVIDQVLAENPGPADQFRNGKEGALNALVGQVMKKTRGAANPKLAADLLRARLSG
jgi:aspartyl-tRNA(Asn)/glutamyl-tRNA(Gln) amidotransferase subunit B